jgi:PAS domain S-box-containing protein
MSRLDDRTSLNTGTIRFRRLRVRIAVLGVLALVAFDAASVYDSWRSYRHSIVATDREIGNLARSLADQTSWTWQGVDLLLDDTASWYLHDGQDMPPERLKEVLANRTAAVRQVRQIAIVDTQGIQRYRSWSNAPDNLNVSDRSYFIAQRDHTVTGFFLSEPLITRSENRSAVVVSHRLERDNGEFAGVITADVDLDDLKQFYTAINLESGSAVHLIRDDGTLLVRNPATPQAVAHKFPALIGVTSDATSRIVSPIDGRKDFIAVARVRDVPLFLAVTRQEDAALRPWREEAIRVGIRTVIVTFLGVLTIAALLRQLRRVETGERALRESEERYALAMEGANEGHWDWDMVTDRMFISPKMKILSGLREDCVFNTRSEWMAAIVIHPDDAPLRDAALLEHFAGRTPRYACEYRIQQPSGSWCWLSARGRCLRDAAGVSYRFVGSAIDITAQKQAQLEKEHLETQLRQSQKMEAIGTLAGGIAHDFNNILGAILGYGELAQQQAPPGSTLRRYMDNVMHAAERAKALVDRILGFSRSGLGERVPMNVQSVIEETLELLSASLPAGIRLEKRLEAGDAAVIGDATYLHQVAMNLCTNALHAMEHGGVLSVLLERVDLNSPRVLSRGTLSTGSYVRLSVSDTGSGIAPGVLERMFDPFFTTKGVGQGTGLGLSLVHGIVSELGGVIDVATQAGNGSSFSIWLPLAPETEEPSTTAAGELPRGHGEVVMIVDDERPLVTLAEEMLAELGYDPVGFPSSCEALRAFRADPRRFELVLTDEAMPDLVGTELASEIRKLQPAIPIILMSGHGGPQLEKSAAAIGVNDVLHKPLRSRDLAESLARVLGASRLTK